MIEVKDSGVFAAMLDEAEDFLKTAEPAAKEKAARLINQITNKAAELIEEAYQTPALSFSVVLPNRYYTVVDALDAFTKNTAE